MVDTRQVLKNNIEAELKQKIENAQKVLGQFREAVHQVEANSAKVKGEVNDAIESIEQRIGTRKSELTKQIDVICHKQINSLQEEIQAACVALGSLQSTLSNLEFLDQTQLRKLHTPDLVSNCCPTVTPVELNVDNSILHKEIRTWGNINSGDTSTSNNFNRQQPKLPYKCYSESSPVAGFEILDIEQWLSGVNLQSAPENDEFEFVMSENTEQALDVPERDLSCHLGRDETSQSSKASFLEPEPINDLSKWLKPRNRNKSPLSTTEHQCNAAYIHNPLKNRFVDFPCLRTDPKTWVPSKRVKTMNGSTAAANASKIMFPPEYALPAPFWLKRH